MNPMNTLLIANRGEIAIRIARSAAELGLATVAVYAEDDALSLHLKACDQALPLKGVGAAPYLDIDQILAAARLGGCDAVHPGYGFLSENAHFAHRCAEAGLNFVGPDPAVLGAFGDKARARALAVQCGIPVLEGTADATTLEEAQAFFAGLGPGAGMMVKAIAGGGGRGMRAVHSASAVATAWQLCRSEALQAFGQADVYVERLFPRARHIEVQIVGDGHGGVAHLWERECSLQRQRQKLIEIAPAPGLDPAMRQRLLAAAVAMAQAVNYRNLGTFEFLVDASLPGGSAGGNPAAGFAFIEANARLQVEHTVTEAVTGLDLVALQLRIARGERLPALGLAEASRTPPRGLALQARVNLETMADDGTARPTGGVLTAYEPPSGPGIRVDGFGYAGYRTGARFDSLIAKVITQVGDTGATAAQLAALARKASRALAEFRITGVATNIGFLQALLRHPAFLAGEVHTRFVDEHIATLLADAAAPPSARHFAAPPPAAATAVAPQAPRLAGAKVDALDPLAVLDHGRRPPQPGEVVGPAALAPEVAGDAPGGALAGPEGSVAVSAPMLGTVVALEAAVGDTVRAGQALFIMEAMKMQHVVAAPTGGRLVHITVAVGDTVYQQHPLAFIAPGDDAGMLQDAGARIDLDLIRPDLAEVLARQALTLDERRPDAVARRRATGQRTARENIADLVDEGSFHEYGGLVVAARRRTVALDELIRTTQADSVVMGLARVNGHWFGAERSRVAVVAYDYTVLAGTQGRKGHEKKDRMFKLAEQWRLPLVLFAEGGGGRGSDTDAFAVGSLQLDTFHRFARLSGLVPLVGIASGRCFAGNAVLLGCCDVVIATANASIGMGGPAMIEGGGLGVYRPEEVGPMSVQVPNGVVDIAVADEAEAVAVARQYLSYFQGTAPEWDCADQRRLRHVVPPNRLRAYDMRELIVLLADTGSLLEIRKGFGAGMITALIRIEGVAFGVVANNPAHLAGAIDSPAADKAARFMQLCDAHDIPLVFLCDTPGNMVGPEHEKTALVRHCCRTYLVGANVSVPTFTVVIRKGYGLGALGMAGGSFHASVFTIAWPTGEFGGMGLEGQVKLGRRKELQAISDPAERRTRYEQLVAEAYEGGKALNTASLFELDNVIDPADTRDWLLNGLRAMPAPPRRDGKKRACVDAW
jgi:acetyl/propionyl-CoA carboxylase alpha subunit/acetyl-CoA carboxylase carboxyltransferase component